MSAQPDAHQEDARRRLVGAAGALASARNQLASEGLPPGIACFLAHLTAEKALKAVLVALQHPLKKNHDLIELLDLILARNVEVDVDRRELRRLNPWAIDGRYLEDVPDAPSAPAEDLISVAAKVLAEAERCVDEVGQRPPEPELLSLELDEGPP